MNTKQKTMAEQENLRGKVKAVYAVSDGRSYDNIYFDEKGRITLRERNEKYAD